MVTHYLARIPLYEANWLNYYLALNKEHLSIKEIGFLLIKDSFPGPSVSSSRGSTVCNNDQRVVSSRMTDLDR